MNEAELLKAFEDREFTEKIFKLETIEEVQKAFKDDKNIDISLEELEILKKAILESVDKLKKGEITEEELANVAGGALTTGEKVVFGVLGAAALVGGGVLIGHNIDAAKIGYREFFSGIKDDLTFWKKSESPKPNLSLSNAQTGVNIYFQEQ